jgi:hypothetical protein
MRTVLFTMVVVMMALANAATMVSEPFKGAPGPSYIWDGELSIDNGTPGNAWIYNTGAGAYVAVDYTKPTGYPWLTGIKYAIHTTWPDSTFQGYGVCAWTMSGGVPGAFFWPSDGIPIYNPNTSGTPGDPGANYKWIIQDVDSIGLPDSFLVGITFLYNSPASDAIAVDKSNMLADGH